MRSLFLLIPSLGVVTSLSFADTPTAGHLVKVREILFKGNVQLTNEKLKAPLAIKEGDLIHISEEKNPLDREVQKLNFLYLKEGYVQAKIDQPDIVFDSDKKSVQLVFNLHEGRRYKMGKIEFSGKWPITQNELLAATQLHRQRFFDYEILQNDLKVLQQKCGDEFYPLPRTRIRAADGEVDLTFELVHKEASA